MKNFRFLDHPADLKIQAFGQNQEELFINAALAMMTFLYPKQVEMKEHEAKEKIRLKSTDIKALLVDWLAELLELSNEKDVCYNDFHFDKLEEDELVAIAYGRRVKAKEDIKGVIDHNLKIEKTEQGWQAVILFDI